MFQNPVNEFQILLKAFSYLKTHWWVFVLEIVAIYSLSFYKFNKTTPVYQSDATLLIDTSRRQLYQAMVMPGFQVGGNARKQNLVHLLTSHDVMERFRNQFLDYYNAEGRPAHLHNFFPGGVLYHANVLRNWITLNWDRNSDIYNIRCSAENPGGAHDLCLVFLNTIQTYYPEIGQREAMMKRDFLSRQIHSFTRQITEREAKLTSFQKENEDFFNFIMLTVEEKGLQKLRSELGQIKSRIATNRAVYKLILSVPRAKRGEHTARETVISALTKKISDLEYQVKLTETSDHPDREGRVNMLSRDLADAQSQLGRVNEEEVEAFIKNPIPTSSVRTRIAELEIEYRTDLIRISSIEKEVDNLVGKERRYNQLHLEYDRMLAELNHKRKLLTNLYQKEQEAELELSAGNAEIFRLQEPTQNGARVAPQLTKHLYGALSFCIFVIAVSVVLLMAFFPRLDSEAEVHRLNLPVLGKVPLLRRNANTLDDIPTFGLEYLKIMNYRILRETKELKSPIVVVSSPHAREGKSTVIHFLTLASQSPSRKAILIDGDLLTSHPNKFFGIQEDQTPGLKSVLEGENIPLSSLVVKTMHDGLYVLPRGGRFDPAALPNFLKPVERLLEQLRREYDIIFIDTPPLFASNLAHQWAGLADLIVLVARIYSTRPKDIAEAIQTCKIFSKAPVGIALNCVPITGPHKRASNYYFSRRKSSSSSRLAA